MKMRQRLRPSATWGSHLLASFLISITNLRAILDIWIFFPCKFLTHFIVLYTNLSLNVSIFIVSCMYFYIQQRWGEKQLKNSNWICLSGLWIPLSLKCYSQLTECKHVHHHLHAEVISCTIRPIECCSVYKQLWILAGPFMAEVHKRGK